MVAPSLALIPTGFKDGKLYSVLPESGAGDFDVVRGSGATRVNKDGLIEDVRILSGELITNGDFSNGTTGWDFASSWSISGGKAICNASGGFGSFSQENVLTIGKKYKVTLDFDGSGITSGVIRMNGGSFSNSASERTLVNGKNILYLDAVSTSFGINESGAIGIATIDNISVKEITDATNIPRLDYTDGGCPVLLVEPQSTNLIEYSEDFSQWSDSNVVLTNNIASPDGASGATLLSGDGASSFSSLSESLSASGDVSYSLFVKKQLRDTIALILQGTDIGGAGDTNAVYSYTFSTNSFASLSSASAESFSAQPLVDGWIRLQLNFTSTTITTCRIYPAYGTASTDGVYIWGAQLEELSHATSYIPTSGAIATRLADSVTGAGDATTFNSTEGVLYAEMAALESGSGLSKRVTISDGTLSNRITISVSDNIVSGFVNVNNATQYSFFESGQSTLSYNKIAVKYKENDFSFFINGTKYDVETSGSTFATNTLTDISFNDGLGGNNFYGKVKDLRTYNTALSDAELQTLTTL